MKKKEKQKSTLKYWGIIVASLLLVGFLTPVLFKNLKFGLDLQGGFEVLYEVESLTDEKLDSDMVESTYKTISRRIDEYGVSEPVIQIEGDNRIRVQLAGVKSPEEARRNLSQVASLTFRDTKDNLLMTAEVIKNAKVGTDQKGLPAVALQIKNKTEFYDVTKKISNSSDNRIVIWVDFEEGVNSFESDSQTCGEEGSRCLSAAYVSEAFSDDVIIQGNFTQDEVKSLVSNINSGSLPTKLTEISSKTVDASFGENSLNKTFIAGLIGLILVMIIMTVSYRFAGFLASIGLIVYTFLTFLSFWLVGGVLTLPGIAAVLLGIGMAVDANVLNFSRIKDELKRGTSFESAFKKGNSSSLKTIIDANVTTFLVAIILFIFGESSIKGFATMLMISIFVTMLVMVGLTRFILKMFVNTGLFNNKVKFFIGNYEKKNKEINYVALGKKFVIVTLVIIVAGIVLLATKGLNLGIDFKGGSVITIDSTSITDEKLKNDLKEYKLNIDEIDRNNDVTMITVTDNLTNKEIKSINNMLNEKYKVNTDISVVTNLVKKELIKNAIYSIILSIIGIILYLTCRFRFSYGVSSVIALIHDVFMIIIMFSLFNLEVSTIFIAAILSIIGYSINNTIVVFDRLKENLNKETKIKTIDDLEQVVNNSIKETISRSIITSLTTIFPVIALILFGSYEIFNFNIALLIGLVFGTYSSLFISTYVWLKIEKRNIGKPKKKKWYEEKEVEEKRIKGINS